MSASNLCRLKKQGIPVTAILFQGVLALFFILSSTFESVLIFSSFVLGVNTLFAVLGVFLMRFRKQGIAGAYRTFAYPFAPLIYLSITLWTLIYVLILRPQEEPVQEEAPSEPEQPAQEETPSETTEEQPQTDNTDQSSNNDDENNNR